MKKKILISMGIVGLATAIFALGVFAATDIKLFINGKAIDSDIQIINGSSYVPLRVVSESLGAVVKWDGDARTINITSGTPAATPAPIGAAKSFSVNVNVDSGPMKMSISKVTLDPAYKKDEYSKAINAVVLDVAVENTTADSVNWYPSHGTIVLNTKEQTDGMKSMYYSDDVDGTFIGKVVKTGKIVFEVKSDLTQVNSISYVVGGASDPKTYMNVGDDKTTELILK